MLFIFRIFLQFIRRYFISAHRKHKKPSVFSQSWNRKTFDVCSNFLKINRYHKNSKPGLNFLKKIFSNPLSLQKNIPVIDKQLIVGWLSYNVTCTSLKSEVKMSCADYIFSILPVFEIPDSLGAQAFDCWHDECVSLIMCTHYGADSVCIMQNVHTHTIQSAWAQCILSGV